MSTPAVTFHWLFGGEVEIHLLRQKTIQEIACIKHNTILWLFLSILSGVIR